MIINYKFKRRNTIDSNEIKAVNKVLKKGILSDFIATSGKGFNGGNQGGTQAAAGNEE